VRILEKPDEMRNLSEEWRAEGLTVGFVATMGALHEGHLSLMRRAHEECDRLVVSIFVNPTQFAAGEDYDTYARPFERDAALLREEGCDALFAPSVEAMYGETSLELSPSGGRVYVEAAGLGDVWEGATRPGHMRGVATIVAMLLNIVRAHRAYFGEKDYQQLKVIERMVRDLFFGVEIIPCPTIRELDGLALSSRNINLSPEEREAALALSRALRAAQDARDPQSAVSEIKRICEAEPLVVLRYAAVVDAETLAPLEKSGPRPARALISADVGTTHLIDNAPL
jgi:pantoate--beta-alanine ligase